MLLRSPGKIPPNWWPVKSMADRYFVLPVFRLPREVYTRHRSTSGLLPVPLSPFLRCINRGHRAATRGYGEMITENGTGFILAHGPVMRAPVRITEGLHS